MDSGDKRKAAGLRRLVDKHGDEIDPFLFLNVGNASSEEIADVEEAYYALKQMADNIHTRLGIDPKTDFLQKWALTGFKLAIENGFEIPKLLGRPTKEPEESIDVQRAKFVNFIQKTNKLTDSQIVRDFMKYASELETPGYFLPKKLFPIRDMSTHLSSVSRGRAKLRNTDELGIDAPPKD